MKKPVHAIAVGLHWLAMRRRPISGEEERLLLRFAYHLARTVSPASVAAYQSDIRLFAETTPSVFLPRFTEAQEDAHLAMLESAGLKLDTLKRKGTAFRYFREFLSRADHNRSINGPAPAAAGESKAASRDIASESRNAIDKGIRGFLQSIQQTRSPSTIRAYTSDLLKLQVALANKRGWEHITKQLITDFLGEQINSGLGANSAVRLLAAVRSLFRWLKLNGFVVGNPASGIRLPRAENRKPLPALYKLEAIADTAVARSFPQLRDRVIFDLLYRCGLGVSEIAALDVTSVQLSERKLSVKGRRSRERHLDLPEATVAALDAYLAELQARSNSETLIVNLRGGSLTTRSIGRIIKRLATSKKLSEDTHPVTLRQAFVTQSLRSGKNIQQIRHDLGVTGSAAVVKISRAAR